MSRITNIFDVVVIEFIEDIAYCLDRLTQYQFWAVNKKIRQIFFIQINIDLDAYFDDIYCRRLERAWLQDSDSRMWGNSADVSDSD